MRIGIRENGLFHVHTYRCGHAQDVPDEAYVRQAIAMEAPEIWFSDHAPFPEDPFLQRMKYAELDEYLTTLQELKAKYRRQIDVHTDAVRKSSHPFYQYRIRSGNHLYVDVPPKPILIAKQL